MMKMTQYKSASAAPLHKQFASTAAKLILMATTAVWTSIAVAGAPTSDEGTNSTNVNTAYVDSIHQWGAWELDIEPAAGGLQQPSSQALNARGSKVSLRANSISALAPTTSARPTTRAIPATPAIPRTPTTPTVPAIPAAPTAPAPPGATPGVVVILP